MFTFALQAINMFFSFSTSFRYLRKEEEGIWKKAFRTKLQNHWPAQLLHVSGIECQSDHFTCFAAYFSSFPKENAFQNLEESFWTINRKTEFTDFSLTLTISKIFRDFSKHSLTFPWPWKIFVFLWLLTDRGNPEYLNRNIKNKSAGPR